MHRFAVFFALLLFLLTASSVSATTPSPRPLQERNAAIRESNQDYRESVQNTRKEYRASVSGEREALRNEVREAKDERREEVRDARQEFRTDKAGQHADRLERRFRWYAERLGAISSRLQDRITKEKSAGKNVAQAQSLLDTAKVQLATAVSDGEKAVSLFRAIPVTTWNLQKPEVKAAIEQAQKARKGFSDTRGTMIDALKAL